MGTRFETVRILGIDFFNDSLETALDIAHTEGGLFLAPSGPGLAELGKSPAYDAALQAADINLIDSGYLALLWRKHSGQKLYHHSGLEFIKRLIEDGRFKQNGRQLWVMPSEDERRACQIYLESKSIELPDTAFYIAPHYQDANLSDPELFEHIRTHRPDYVILAIAGGKQEILGHWLATSLDYEPSVICIGAAIAFLSGKQVKIPDWADRIFIGWLLRIFSNPHKYFPRYWAARKLAKSLKRWGTELPKPS